MSKPVLRLFCLLPLGLYPLGCVLAEAIQPPCAHHMSLNLANGSRADNGSIFFDGLAYPPETQFQFNDELRGCPCLLRNCIRRCCPPGTLLDKKQCHEPNQLTNSTDYFDGVPLLPKNIFDSQISNYEEHFYIIYNKQCFTDQIYGYALNSYNYFITQNGTLSVSKKKDDNILKVLTNEWYCIAKVEEKNEVFFVWCQTPAKVLEKIAHTAANWTYAVGCWLSATFLIMTFAVYAMFASLRNLHGQIIMTHVACLSVAYIFSPLINQEYLVKQLSLQCCTIIAYIVHFSFLASFFWLNVMCFDIWWTFGGFRSLHGSVKQRERKKFIIYSIYAWGCASIITIICMIMDLAPGIPASFIRPEFGKQSCWFSSDIARAIYFYVPMGVTVFCNICLFILTAVKILRHKKDTARQLKGSDSRRHDDNKQWFNLYLKLFIVMGINWSMEIISWIFEKHGLPKYVWYITDLTNTLQGVIIFIIFVWKDKIKRLLMKRFGCQGGNFLSRNSTRSGCPTSSTSRATCVTSAPLQEKSNPYVANTTFRSKSNVTDESDCI